MFDPLPLRHAIEESVSLESGQAEAQQTLCKNLRHCHGDATESHRVGKFEKVRLSKAHAPALGHAQIGLGACDMPRNRRNESIDESNYHQRPQFRGEIKLESDRKHDNTAGCRAHAFGVHSVVPTSLFA